MVIKSASPIRMEFGGTCAVPTADLIIDNTTIILKKDVTEISRKGSKDIKDKASNNWTLLLMAEEFIMLAMSRPALFGAA
jgi:hypothetical protein